MKSATSPRKVSPEARAAADAITNFTLRAARPLFWHRGVAQGGPVKGGSAFVLKFGDNLIGVTADHVMKQYLDDLATNRETRCQLGDHRIFPEWAIVDRSSKLDIATFSIPTKDASQVGGYVFDCSKEWPPPAVEVGDTITLTGFLDTQRTKIAPGHLNLPAWGAYSIADGVSERDIITAYDPECCLGAEDAPKPPLGLNLSGCSGGPVILHKLVNGLWRWFPVALIYEGPGAAKGGLAEFDTVRARRLHFIQLDGTLKEPDKGWLPD